MQSDGSSYSSAGPGVGVSNPDTVSKYNVTQGGIKTGLIIRWDGNEYTKKDCWIRAEIDDVISLKEYE